MPMMTEERVGLFRGQVLPAGNEENGFIYVCLGPFGFPSTRSSESTHQSQVFPTLRLEVSQVEATREGDGGFDLSGSSVFRKYLLAGFSKPITEGGFKDVLEIWMIAFDYQEVVGTAFSNGLGDFLLSKESIPRHHSSWQVLSSQQSRGSSDLIFLANYSFLTKNTTSGVREQRDEVMNTTL